jgi:hypothetical protein
VAVGLGLGVMRLVSAWTTFRASARVSGWGARHAGRLPLPSRPPFTDARATSAPERRVAMVAPMQRSQQHRRPL